MNESDSKEEFTEVDEYYMDDLDMRDCTSSTIRESLSEEDCLSHL